MIPCLRSLSALNYPKDRIQIVVVDSSEEAPSIPTDLTGRVILIHRQCTAPAAYNLAFPSTTGDVIAFIDSDAVADPDWLRTLISGLADSTIGGVGGNIRTWNTENPLARSIGYELERRYGKMPELILRVSTSNLIVWKHVLTEVGGVDETLPTGYDAKLGADINALGYRIRFQPQAVVYHFHRPTLAAYYRQQRTYAVNDIRLYAHGFPRKVDSVTTILMFLEWGTWIALLLSLATLVILDTLWAQNIFREGARIVAIGIAIYFVILAARGVRVAIENRDLAALLWYPLLLLARVLAWTTGTAHGLLRALWRGRSGTSPA